MVRLEPRIEDDSTRGLEEELLGLLLVNPAAYWSVAERVGAEDFVDPSTHCMWRAMEVTHSRGSFTFSLLEANARDVPEEMTFGLYLHTLIAMVERSESVNPDDIADTLAERSARRRLMGVIESARSLAADRDASVEDSVAKIVEAVMQAAGAGARSDRFSANLPTLMRHAAQLAAEADGPRSGISVGIPEIEALTGQWMPGDLVVLGGSSGSGKSALAMQVAWHVARSLPVNFHQLEMDGMAMAQRHLASIAGVPMSRIRLGGVGPEDAEALLDASRTADLTHRNFDLRWRPRQTTAQIRAAALAAKGRHGRLGLVVVDHNKLVRVERRRGDPPLSRIDQIAQAMDDLKALAKEAGCVVLMLSQITRTGRQRMESGGYTIRDIRPHSTDCYGGGDMEEYADIMLLAHRPEQTLAKVEPSTKRADDHASWSMMMNFWAGKAEIIAEKVRYGEAGKAATMKWNGARTRYETLPPLDDWT